MLGIHPSFWLGKTGSLVKADPLSDTSMKQQSLLGL